MRETGPVVQSGDFLVALSLLSRLPLRLDPAAYARGARTAWAWPLVGGVLAGAAALVALLAQANGLPHHVAAALAVVTLVVCSGAMHEDGLADVADGFWGGHDRARRLEIMKDSRIGAYGVIALILSLMLRVALLAALGAAMLPGLLTAAMLSRAAMALVMQALPNARGTGLSHATGRPGWPAVRIALGLAGLGALLLWGWAVLWAIIAVAMSIFATTAIARQKIGGQTGDVLGSSQQLAEIAVLLALTASL